MVFWLFITGIVQSRGRTRRHSQSSRHCTHRLKYFNGIKSFKIFRNLTDAVREVVVARCALIAESAPVVLLAGTLEVAATALPALRHADGKTGLILQSAVRVAGTGLAVRVVVVALGTGTAVLRSPEGLQALTQSVLRPAVTGVSGVRAVTGWKYFNIMSQYRIFKYLYEQYYNYFNVNIKNP